MQLLLMHDSGPMQTSPEAGAIVPFSHSTRFITNGIPGTKREKKKRMGFLDRLLQGLSLGVSW